MELAIYGKGGIGKSTVSANLTAALAAQGVHMLQIGCDPKHDSTRLLMHGETIPTVLDYLKEADRAAEDIHAVLKTGYLGTGCVEAGGPKPGVGCAGRGIISAFEFLNRHQVKEKYDMVVYDVLGDVVCGGFAVPVRREYADAIYLVTSGEYMALYAANNILRGIRNFDGDLYRRVGGIIYNERKLEDEDGRVSRFAKAVGLPICIKIPRSQAFACAEEQNVTVMELDGYQREKEVFLELAGRIKDGVTLYPARPLTDFELEQVVLKNEMPAGASRAELVQEKQTISGNTGLSRSTGATAEASAGVAPPADRLPDRAPLYGCAFNGVCTTAIHLTDALVIAHSPTACAFYTWQNISSPGRKNLFNRGILMPSALSPNFSCTEMGQAEAVFGGMDRLKECVHAALERRPGAVIVVSSCVSGIIGDDITDIETLSEPEIPVIAIRADGDINGDYMEGVRMCMYRLAERLIDPDIRPQGRLVNLINEGSCLNNRDVNYDAVKTLLAGMGISIHCRFLGDATAEELRTFLRAPLNILADDGEESQKLKDWLVTRYGCSFAPGALPVGRAASEQFLRTVGAYFDCMDKAELLISRENDRFRERIEALKPVFSGKSLILTTINVNLDWLLEAVHAVGMEVPWIGVLNYLHTEIHITDHPEYCGIIDEEVDWGRIHDKIEELHPDIVLSNYTSTVADGEYLTDTMPMNPVVGFDSGLRILERWASLLKKEKNNREGRWRNDEALFRKYFS